MICTVLQNKRGRWFRAPPPTVILETSRLSALKLYIICSNFKSLKFFQTPILKPLRSHFAKLLIKSRNQIIFEKFKLNWNLQRIPFKMMYNVYVTSSVLKWMAGRGRGAPWTTFLSYFVKLCIFCRYPPICNRTLPIMNWGNWGNKDESSFNAMAATKWQILKLKFKMVEYPGTVNFQFEPNQ